MVSRRFDLKQFSLYLDLPVPSTFSPHTASQVERGLHVLNETVRKQVPGMLTLQAIAFYFLFLRGFTVGEMDIHRHVYLKR